MFKQLFLIFIIILSANIFPADTNMLPKGTPVTVIGIGKLGLCFALCLEKAGFNVMGVDINTDYVATLNNKTFNSLEPDVNTMLYASTKFTARCSLDDGLAFSNIYYISVDTPFKDKESYDHKNLNTVLTFINNKAVSDKHIIIGCTIFPGYIKNIGKNLINQCKNTTLNYNPSFIAQGNIIQGFHNPDLILIGEESPEAGNIIARLHHAMVKNNPSLHKMNPSSAEIAKLSINCFITTKIAFANMIGDIADNTEAADKNAILSAVGADQRIGHRCLNPGYGFGGPCFPRDNRALACYAKTVQVTPLIPEATDQSNQAHLQHMANQLLIQHKEKYVFESVTYKEKCPVPIIEESQKLLLAVLLAKKYEKKVIIVDTPAVIAEVKKTYSDLFEYQII